MADIAKKQNNAKKPVGITETILRDAHQSLIATRMTTEEMLPILETMDGIGYHSSRTAQHACHKLEDQQHAIDYAAAYRHAVDGLLPLPVIFLFHLFLIPLFHLFPSFLLIPLFHHSLLIYSVFYRAIAFVSIGS